MVALKLLTDKLNTLNVLYKACSFEHAFFISIMKATYYITLLFLNLLLSCNSQNQEAMEHQYTNDLVHETSPYLLQHAHNPVNWKAWNETSLQEAKDKNKLLLISVGYAACHWCHVMEHESFEDEVVAQVMNENYVNIKIDREERPDICLLYTSPSPRDGATSRMPSSA